MKYFINKKREINYFFEYHKEKLKEVRTKKRDIGVL